MAETPFGQNIADIRRRLYLSATDPSQLETIMNEIKWYRAMIREEKAKIFAAPGQGPMDKMEKKSRANKLDSNDDDLAQLYMKGMDMAKEAKQYLEEKAAEKRRKAEAEAEELRKFMEKHDRIAAEEAANPQRTESSVPGKFSKSAARLAEEERQAEARARERAAKRLANQQAFSEAQERAYQKRAQEAIEAAKSVDAELEELRRKMSGWKG